MGFLQIRSRWVVQSLKNDHRFQRKTLSFVLLERLGAKGEQFMPKNATGDEAWMHHLERETKRQFMEWHHPQSPRRKKLKTTPLAGKFMINVLWDNERAIFIVL